MEENKKEDILTEETVVHNSEQQTSQEDTIDQPISMAERMEKEMAQMPTLDHPSMKESIQMQKAAWIKEEIEKQRKQEDLLMKQIWEEQRLLREMDDDMDEKMAHTKEGRKYRHEMKERINRHVYDMNGLSEDKLEGMRHYNGAYYRGFALAMFLLSAALSGFTIYLHGIESQICLVMLFFTGVQASILIQQGKSFRIWSMLSKLLDLLVFPSMLVIFIGYELKYTYYALILPYWLAGGLVILVLSTLAYFMYDPYRAAKRRIGDAKSMIRAVEKSARKQVKKNEKLRVKEEAKQERIQMKEEAKQEQIQQKATARLENAQAKEEARAAKRESRATALAEKKRQFLSWFNRTEVLEPEDIVAVNDEDMDDESFEQNIDDNDSRNSATNNNDINDNDRNDKDSNNE